MKPLLLALVLIGGVVFRAAAQNMVVYDDALENGWGNYGWATINYSNTSPVHSGSDSISVTDPGTTSEALYLGHTVFNPSPFQSISFWIYPTAAGTNELQVQAELNGVQQTPVPLSFTAAQVGKWQQETISLASLGVAGNPAFSGFWIQNNTGGPLTFYVDDVSLVAATPPDPVPLTVTPASVVRTIDSRIYGVNITQWDQLLSGTTTTWALNTMQTGALRFPGGSNSDDYDWHTDEQVSNPTFQWVNNASTFAGITATQGAQAFVTVNYGSGTPQEAEAWVAYYNGSAASAQSIGTDSRGVNWQTVGYWASIRGATPLAQDDGYNFLRASHPAPYGITYWEIGNECYGSWENDLHGTSGSELSGTAHDPYTYAEYFQTFYNDMRAADSAIHIGAVSAPGEDSYGVSTHGVANPYEGNSVHSGWTPVMLATLKSLGVTPDFMIDHNYPQYPGGECDSILLQDAGTLTSDGTNLRQMINDYFGTGGTSIELDVTELNSVSSGPGKQTTSLVNGLFMADAIGTLANTEFDACTWWAIRGGADTSANNSSLLYGWREYGDYAVLTSGDVSGTPANQPYPDFYSAKLLTNWGRGGDLVVSATSGSPMLSIYAAQKQNGNLELLVINKDPAANLPAQVTLNGFTPGSLSAPFYIYGKANDLAVADITTGTVTLSGSSFSYTYPSYSMSVMTIESQFEYWREQNFTTAQLSNWSYSGDNGNPANDGVPNLLKYALGLNPNQTTVSGLPIPGQVTVSGSTYPTLTFTDQKSLTDIKYTVQVSTNLQNWNSGPAYTARVDNGTTNTAVVRSLTPVTGAPRQFMRLSVTRE